MASKIILIVSFVAIANGNVYEQAQAHYEQVQAQHAQINEQINAQIQAQAQAIAQSHNNGAKYVWVPDDDNEAPAPPGFRRMYVPSQGFHHFPHHQPFNFAPVNIPSPEDIKNFKPESGQVFKGVSLRSSSGFGKDKNGKTIRTGGSTVVTNDNGDMKETKAGENPPDIEDPIVFPSPHEFVKMPDHVPFKPFVFKPFTFKPITFKPIDMNYVPAEGENYAAVSSSSHSESSDVNGVKTSSGGTNDMVNLNGAVDQAAVEYRKGDDPDKAEVIVEDE